IRITKVARGNGPSTQPENSGGGEYVVFTSAASDFPGVTGAVGDVNGQPDVFLWTGQRNLIRLMSADGDNNQLTLPSSNAYPSQRINYVLFETHDPYADKPLAKRTFEGQDPQVVAEAAQANPSMNQIYM